MYVNYTNDQTGANESERALPSNDFITTFRKNNAKKELEIKMDSYQQME